MKRKEREVEAMAEQSAKSISEGKATVHFESEASVFYNPVQEFNRDLRYRI
jgi:tRNA G26 N,N-dimethylase Trm1